MAFYNGSLTADLMSDLEDVGEFVTSKIILLPS